ncbi:MAG: excinuclease ABC subunit UvrC [Burkholderiales bacterium]|nr:excinuclease ABC subunit UvrC [Burkholderiales bacterium]
MKINVTADNSFLAQIPDSPGVYRYYASDGELLYVGKALSLIKRVKSYFQKQTDLSPRISLMLSKVTTLELTVTANESSALLLESNLIKNLKPKYNIIFRDDKSYPYIRITQHEFPLIEYFRGKTKPRESVFGPYPNPAAVKETLDTLQRLFKLRTCSDSVFANRSRPCMLHQVNLCCAPCVNKVKAEEYRQYVNYAREFLSGNYGDLVARLSKEMYESADSLDFEQAGVLRDKISLIQQLQSKQIISDSQLPINADILVVKVERQRFYLYMIMLRGGLYVGDKHFMQALVDSEEVLLEAFLERYYADEHPIQTVYLDFGLNPEFVTNFYQIYRITINLKLKARISELAQMGLNNLTKVIENQQLNNIYHEAVVKLCSFLRVDSISRIECYDTSHNQGSQALASMVVYSGGKIDHLLYRKYNLPDSIGGDDLLALDTVLRRRLANSEVVLPEVILVDGGKIQLKITKNLLAELGFYDKIKVIAIFKGEHRKAEYDKIIIDEDTQLSFRQEPQIFRLLQSLRDEAHRFAITGHRKKQIERMSTSRLEDVPGIGATKRRALIASFGSAQGVADAEISQLQQVEGIGFELASQIYKFFH